MADYDLEALSLSELKKMQKDVAKAISTFEDRQKAEARAKVEAFARDLGYSLAELVGAEMALLHKSGDGRGFPLPRTDLSHGFCDGYAERGEAVQDGHTDLELGDLTIEVPCAQPLAQQFQTMHLGFDAAPAVVTAPSSPNGSTEAFRRAKCLVPRDCPRCVGSIPTKVRNAT